MGEGAPRRGSGGRHPRPRPGARTVRSPRWTLGTNSSSQVGGPLARQYRTAQNLWNTWLRISGTHKWYAERDCGKDRSSRAVRSNAVSLALAWKRVHAFRGNMAFFATIFAWSCTGQPVGAGIHDA